MNLRGIAALAPLILLGACANDSSREESTASAPARRSLSERVTEDSGYKQDSEGNWKPKIDRRSSFESQGEAAYFNKDFKKQEYKAGDYAKKSWWGNKEYGRQAYTGDTDGSRFQKSSAAQGQGARESGNAADLPGNYNTSGYATGSARESNSKPVAKGSNDAIEKRRQVFPQPEIIDWKEQRSITMEQSKGILGR